MSRHRNAAAELDEHLDGRGDPVTELPPGSPVYHSKIPPTPSKFVADTVRSVVDRNVPKETPDNEELARREEIRTRFRRISRRR